MFGSLNTSSTAPTKKGNEFKSKKYFKDNKLSGLFQDFDPYTGKLKEEGKFENGMEVGRWRVIDGDGDEIHYSYTM
jgi:antitoxin component YwqK of YwqJK toxin-antitoxin module